MIRSREDLHSYQIAAVKHVIANPRSMLDLEMSLGKTIVTLTAIADMLDSLQIFGAVIFAPLPVVESVWQQESQKWEHTQHLRIVRVLGTERQRISALFANADIYLVNYELAVWFVEAVNRYFLKRKRYPPFTMSVFDEVTRCKHTTGKRASAVYQLMRYTPRRVGLTGTPAPNGYQDLHGQYKMLDDGERLFSTYQRFKETFMAPVGSNGFGSKYVVSKTGKQRIEERIKDITFMLRTSDVLQLPPVRKHMITVTLPPKMQAEYDRFEREFFIELQREEQRTVHSVVAANSASLTNKCRQYANGMMLGAEGVSEALPVHDLKLQALESVIEEANGKPVLLAYVFRADMVRILRHFRKRKNFRMGFLGQRIHEDAGLHREYLRPTEETVERWNEGEYHLLLTHPQAAGHGLNLQHGGNHLVRYGVDWNLEYHEQVLARVLRQGQRASFVVDTWIVCDKTLEMVVVKSVNGKGATQDGFKANMVSREAIEEYKAQKGIR